MARGKVTVWNGRTGSVQDNADGRTFVFGGWSLSGITANQIQVGMEVEFDRPAETNNHNAKNISLARSQTASSQSEKKRNMDAPPRREGRAPIQMRQSVNVTGWVLPHKTQDVIKRVPVRERHPVIQLDRLSIPGDQKKQKLALEDATRAAGAANLLSELTLRRNKMLKCSAKDTRMWKQATVSRLALHLSRSNALENAGLCLHPMYGFAFLPGSGLKGMARAFAVQQKWAPDRVLKIFGNGVGEPKSDLQNAGGVVFHDAWPTSLPRLKIEIVNNHHPDYYAGNDAPGDWESPNPVYFLAVDTGVEFEFALSPRRSDFDMSLLDDAQYLLQMALTHNGAGAKTHAGYGAFVNVNANSSDEEHALNGVVISSQKYTLTFDTPAFLAGATQSEQGDCELRTATLRGQLRQWWRTLYAGFLTVDELRTLEAAVWGDTNQGSAIRLQLQVIKRPCINLHRHPQERDSGLKYLAYGMNDGGSDRFRVETDGEWQLAVATRATTVGYSAGETSHTFEISAEMIQEQFRSALWLLSQFGGVGAKARKGFGSLKVRESLAISALSDIENITKAMLQKINKAYKFDSERAESAAIFHPKTSVRSVEFTANNPIDALEKFGKCYKRFASSRKHNPDKVALGLPRKIHGPKDTPMSHQKEHTPPVPLTMSGEKASLPLKDQRHSAPIHFHLTHLGSNRWKLNAVAFPAKFLPSVDKSSEFLKTLIDEVFAELTMSVAATGNTAIHNTTSTVGFVQVNVTVVVKMGNEQQAHFRVQEEGLTRPGMLIDGTAPASLPQVGDVIPVWRSTKFDAQSPRYRWTPPPPPKQNNRPNRR